MRDTYLDMYLDMTGIAKVTKEKWMSLKEKVVKIIVHLYGLKSKYSKFEEVPVWMF